MGTSSLRTVSVCALYFLCFIIPFHLSQAQNRTTKASTDPNEVRLLNSIFRQWGISAKQGQWNIGGEPCNGAATDSTSFDDPNFNPLIKCDCSFNNGTVCHITQLKVYALNIVGVIPDELWNLTFLFNLNIGQNYLTGPLSPSVGNLTRMQYLNIAVNALSGELPKELGLLTELISLGFGTNNFSGPLPSELGNLLNLQQLYMDSSGVTGEIPSSFANLKSMNIWWASNTGISGQIPGFIGNWSKLTVLRFQGNSFDSAIPSSFSNLTSLTELRISDLSNGSSTLAFIKDLKSLTTLELRNNNISDSIPSNIGQFQSLQQLDLSFNNLYGAIPDSLFNLSSLNYLFLGNNELNGTLPVETSSSLQNIDVSYNNLQGNLPSWINNQRNLQINLVANNFTIGIFDNGGLAHGLNCLQRNFPCNRGSPIYANFAINCGGPQIRSSNGVVYEWDYGILGPATSYVTDSDNWGVSNVGYFFGSNSPQYTSSSFSQFADTLDSELFQTQRISASSLRYYGLGLQNGNYTVLLQFTEFSILDTSTWQSLGRRVFDVYIQGNRVLKDFDIKLEAGRVSKKAVQKQFNILVSENYLEIHLFWAGKGTCCVPTQGTYGPSISAISVTPDFKPTVSPPKDKKNRTGLIVGIVVGVGVVSFLSIIVVIFCIVQIKKRLQNNDDEELLGMDARPYTFSYAELKTATENFSPSNKLGEGGFGPVYKGKLDDGRVIAVKQLSVGSRQGKSQFVAEIATISAVQHRNLVKLYGCCIEGAERLLVYEYLENKSLDQALFGKQTLNLDWPTRFEICVGVARGLTYLHEESRLRIIHRDVKASNVLLDADLVPKISDFGLAKLFDDKKTHISTRVAGTIGYLAPEYAMRGHLTEKTDVFAFGVLALETVSGRPNSYQSLEEDEHYLLEWAWQLHENNRELELVDSKLSEFNEEEVKRLIGVGLLCTQTLPTIRPSMSRVVAMLCGDMEVSTVTSKPGYLTDWKYEDITSFVSTDRATKGSDTGHFTSSSITSIVAEADHLSRKGSKPILHDLIGEGR